MINKMFLLFLLIILISFLILYNERKRIDLVISRYSESLEWLCDPEILSCLDNDKIDTTIYIYNKGIEFPVELCHHFTKYNLRYIELPNVGRCDHTYLYHIINHYNQLADVTIFLPGSGIMEYKKNRSFNVIKKSYETLNSVFFVNDITLKEVYDFQLDLWLSSDESNKKNNKNDSMLKCDIRPFGKWYEHVYNKSELNYIVFSGIFSVHEEHIRNSSLDFYKKLIKYVETHNNPEAGHYIERSWFVNFQPVKEKCLYKE